MSQQVQETKLQPRGHANRTSDKEDFSRKSTELHAPEQAPDDKIEWVRSIPFFAMHVLCLAVFWVGWSPIAVGMAVVLYSARSFGLTGFYHRYFAHKAFKTSRWFQFVGACLGNAAVQRGPIWWAAHHRAHHQFSDTKHDVHSPVSQSLFHSHIGWILTRDNYKTNERYTPDLLLFPELVWLNRFELVVPFVLTVLLYSVGYTLERYAPGLGTNGLQLITWGLVSTISLHHSTFCVNSICHLIGRRPYKTPDDSRNNFIVAILTGGEGWHNNHHHYPGSARNGFRWWQIDVTYYILVVLSWFHIVWDLKPVPDSVMANKDQN